MIYSLCIVLLFNGFVRATEEAKRSHNHEPMWIEHCWDKSSTHLLDPFCQLLFDAGCDEPPKISNGHFIEPYQKTLNSKVNYVCDDGYQLIGPQFVQCEKGDKALQWTQPPTCKEIICPDVPAVDNASFETPASTNVGIVVKYSCNKGYELVDGNTVECQAGGKWSSRLPKCRKSCDPVPEIANGHSNGVTSTLIGTTVEYVCNTGYKILDNNSTTCLFDKVTLMASWSPLPECRPITCPTPELSGNTEFVFNGSSLINETTFLINDTVQYRCMSGYVFVANQPITTSSPSTTTSSPSTDAPGTDNGSVIVQKPVVDASDAEGEGDFTTTTEYPTTTTEPPTDLDLGNDTDVNETMFTEQTEVPMTTTQAPTTKMTVPLMVTTETPRLIDSTTCQLVGNKGVWTKMQNCVLECPYIPNVDNAVKTLPPNKFVGAKVGYTCKIGYEIVGEKTITCMSNGQWTAIPYCQPVCPEPPKVENGYISNIDDYKKTAGSQLYYVCNEGFTLDGAEVVTCLETFGGALPRMWSATPFCRPTCELPPFISNGTRTEPESLQVGATVNYTCDEEHHLQGPAASTCLRWGNWTEVPKCVPFCQIPPVVPHALSKTYTYNETETVKIVCYEQYELIGNDTLTCNNGTWSKPYPVCECIVKPIDIVFLVDGSGSMGESGFNKTLDFVSDMVNRYPYDTTQFGLLVFGSTTNRQFYLDEYTNNKTELIDTIKSAKFPAGGTSTFEALELARTDMFVEEHGMRANVSHIAIVVTDGRSDDRNRTIEQAELLRNEGVTIYSIGVRDSDMSELNQIASNERFVFHVENYNAISNIEGPLAGVTCEAPQGDELVSSDEEDTWFL